MFYCLFDYLFLYLFSGVRLMRYLMLCFCVIIIVYLEVVFVFFSVKVLGYVREYSLLNSILNRADVDER